MNVQQKIENWCKDEKFMHFANRRMDEEINNGMTDYRSDPEYEALDEAFEWDDRYAVPLATFLTYRLQVATLQKNAKKRRRDVWRVFVQTAMLGQYLQAFYGVFDNLLSGLQNEVMPMLHEEYTRCRTRKNSKDRPI